MLLVASLVHIGNCDGDFHAKDSPTIQSQTPASRFLGDIRSCRVDVSETSDVIYFNSISSFFFSLEEVFPLSLKITAASALQDFPQVTLLLFLMLPFV